MSARNQNMIRSYECAICQLHGSSSTFWLSRGNQTHHTYNKPTGSLAAWEVSLYNNRSKATDYQDKSFCQYPNDWSHTTSPSLMCTRQNLANHLTDHLPLSHVSEHLLIEQPIDGIMTAQSLVFFVFCRIPVTTLYTKLNSQSDKPLHVGIREH